MHKISKYLREKSIIYISKKKNLKGKFNKVSRERNEEL